MVAPMDRELHALAEEVGGDELAERVKRLEDEIDNVEEMINDEMQEDAELAKLLQEDSDLSDSAIKGMSLKAKREVARAAGLRDERANVGIPVAGQWSPSDEKANTGSEEPVGLSRDEPRTYTKQVPIEGGDDPETITVEYQESGPSIEAINEFHGWLNQQQSEATRREQERANARREKQMNGAIPNYEYLNTDDEEADVDDSEIPAPGGVYREADDE